MNKVVVKSTRVAGFRPALSPMIGANCDGKPNFMTHAWRGCLSSGDIVALSMDRRRYTHKGITQNMTFSINVPSVDLAKEAEYCGSVSGARHNKIEVCKFEVFYGKLGTAPLIEQCPLNLECRVIHVLAQSVMRSLIIGRVEETYISDDCLTNGKPDLNKIKALYYGRADRHGFTYHQYLGFEIHPDNPEALANVIGMTSFEHFGVHAGDGALHEPPVDVYGIYRE